MHTMRIQYQGNCPHLKTPLLPVSPPLSPSCQGNMQISQGNGILPPPYAKFKKVKVFRRKQTLQNKMNLALREAQKGEEGEWSQLE